jgi:hypothetical protein
MTTFNRQQALFVETERYAYVLLWPSQPYESVWKPVLAAWNRYSNARLDFVPVNLERSRPCWWKTVKDWDALMMAAKAAKEEQDGANDARKVRIYTTKYC